jgi:hypothetical protein
MSNLAVFLNPLQLHITIHPFPKVRLAVKMMVLLLEAVGQCGGTTFHTRVDTVDAK